MEPNQTKTKQKHNQLNQVTIYLVFEWIGDLILYGIIWRTYFLNDAMHSFETMLLFD